MLEHSPTSSRRPHSPLHLSSGAVHDAAVVTTTATAAFYSIAVTTFLLVFLIRTILILGLIKLVRVLLDKNLLNLPLGLPLTELILEIMFNANDLKLWLKQFSVNELQTLINGARSEINGRRRQQIAKNTVTLEWEIRNLIDSVGYGYTPADHYAPKRYYSSIDGVKNLRIHVEMGEKEKVRVIIVKLLSPKGKLLPEKITVRNIEYNIVFWKSKNYNPTIDY